MSKLPTNQILQGDCVEVLKEFPENSVDEVVTDPPYGIGFMGKDWDKALPSKEAFEQIFRVLKPGALAFVTSSPRQDVLWRMMAMLESVGFELKQSFISWIYKSGFPKAYDVSKGIDKKLDKKRVRDRVIHTRSELYGSRPWLIKAKKDGIYFGESDEPTSILAKKWEGWKGQKSLKPALECILMVNKPMSEKTIVDNVLKHGVGAININGTRIPFSSNVDLDSSKVGFRGVSSEGSHEGYKRKAHEDYVPFPSDSRGRFPANLIVSDGALDNGKITKSPNSYKRKSNGFNVSCYGKGMGESEGKESLNYGDIGGQSRYFDLDAWSRHHGFLDVAKASKSERDMGITSEREKYSDFGLKSRMENGEVTNQRTNTQAQKAKNFHPCVKPVKLMAYLVELGCPEGGVVLDPFCGSGSTLIAAHRLNRKWIGVEIDSEYAEITRHRLSVLNQKLTDFSTLNV